MPINDLGGRTFGRLRIASRAEPVTRNRHAYWPTVCECGSRGLVRGSKLVSGLIVSCGCWRADHDIRQAAAMKISARKRHARAVAGGAGYLAAHPKASNSEV
jgi:hypothetical protein